MPHSLPSLSLAQSHLKAFGCKSSINLDIEPTVPADHYPIRPNITEADAICGDIAYTMNGMTCIIISSTRPSCTRMNAARNPQSLLPYLASLQSSPTTRRRQATTKSTSFRRDSLYPSLRRLADVCTPLSRSSSPGLSRLVSLLTLHQNRLNGLRLFALSTGLVFVRHTRLSTLPSRDVLQRLSSVARRFCAKRGSRSPQC